jgi:hypothetical protein
LAATTLILIVIIVILMLILLILLILTAVDLFAEVGVIDTAPSTDF